MSVQAPSFLLCTLAPRETRMRLNILKQRGAGFLSGRQHRLRSHRVLFKWVNGMQYHHDDVCHAVVIKTTQKRGNIHETRLLQYTRSNIYVLPRGFLGWILFRFVTSKYFQQWRNKYQQTSAGPGDCNIVPGSILSSLSRREVLVVDTYNRSPVQSHFFFFS